MKCLKENDYIAPYCRKEVKEYMQCRMDKGLMAPEPIENLGLPDEKMDPRWMEERKKILQTISKTNNGMEWFAYQKERQRLFSIEVEATAQPSGSAAGKP